ncbi:hypothetical protein C2S52_009986 [Perilla frutescens var. hirtella]|nr:hypothetical protein C2S52_009986 [Perilla frutescens var. hirtella]
MPKTRNTSKMKKVIDEIQSTMAAMATRVSVVEGGLQPAIRERIPDSEMTDVFAAIRAARRIARSVKPSLMLPKSTFSAGPFSRPTTTFRSSPSPTAADSGQHPAGSVKGGQSQLSHTGSSWPRGNRKSRHLTPEQVDDYRAKGKCFKCSQPYTPLHKCASKYLSVIIGAEEKDEGEVNDEGQGIIDLDQVEEQAEEIRTELQQLQLSRLSSNGFDGAQTLKLFTTVKRRRLLTMVDSGASHCFIYEEMAHALQLHIDTTTHFAVILGDGSRVQTRGICTAVPFTIDGHTFHITCYVFSLRSVDVILGVTWLAQLGDVTENWGKLTMSFMRDRVQICLRGDPTLTRRACHRAECYSLEPDDQAWLLWSVEDSPLVRFSTSTSLSAAHQTDLEGVVTDFADVMKESTGLPPQRPSDHRITLHPGTTPVSSSVRVDSKLSGIIQSLAQGQPGPKHYTFSQGTLFYKGRIVLPRESDWIPKLIEEFHATPGGGHSGAFRTYRRLAGNLYWPGMMKAVTKFVAACDICQRHKNETKCPAGLLNPLPIPSRIWEDISMDFITGLPRSGGVDCILALAEFLQERDGILEQLRVNLDRAQQRMLREANKHRRPLEFVVGDKVYLKFRPHRQRTLFANPKLAPRFFGPFVMEGRVGSSAYRLQLPAGSRIHPVFHVSLLKPAIGGVIAAPTLPEELLAVDPPFLPAQVMQRRQIIRDGSSVPQVLVQWQGLSEEDRTWMDEADMKCQFPDFSLVDKVVLAGEAVDRAAREWRVYVRKKKQLQQ